MEPVLEMGGAGGGEVTSFLKIDKGYGLFHVQQNQSINPTW